MRCACADAFPGNWPLHYLVRLANHLLTALPWDISAGATNGPVARPSPWPPPPLSWEQEEGMTPSVSGALAVELQPHSPTRWIATYYPMVTTPAGRWADVTWVLHQNLLPTTTAPGLPHE